MDTQLDKVEHINEKLKQYNILKQSLEIVEEDTKERNLQCYSDEIKVLHGSSSTVCLFKQDRGRVLTLEEMKEMTSEMSSMIDLIRARYLLKARKRLEALRVEIESQLK